MNFAKRWMPSLFRRIRSRLAMNEDRPRANQPPTSSLSQPAQPTSPARQTSGSRAPLFVDLSKALERPLFVTPLKIIDAKDELRIATRVPDLDKGDLEVSVIGHVLTIRGEKRHMDHHDDDGFLRTERYYAYMQRQIPLPPDLDESNAEASLADGVLTLRFPKGATEGRNFNRIVVH